jgi:hypothetical protein
VCIEDTLKTLLLNVSDVSHVQINREELVVLFKADRKCDFTLEGLNSHCDEMMCEESPRQQPCNDNKTASSIRRSQSDTTPSPAERAP